MSASTDSNDFVRRADDALDAIAQDERWRSSAQMLREGIAQLAQTGEERWQAIERLAPAAKALRMRSQRLETLLGELREVLDQHAPGGLSREQVERCLNLISGALRQGP